MSFEAFEAAVRDARAALDAAKRAEERAKSVRWDCGRVKPMQERGSYSDTKWTPEQTEVSQAMIAARDAATEALALEARNKALLAAADALTRARAHVPHLLAAAMIDLGAQAAQLRRTAAGPIEGDTP